MLYDKRWDRTETKPDVFSLESLIAWAEKQPSNEKYDFWCNQCYLGRYFEAHGYRIDMIGTGTVTLTGKKAIPLPPHFGSIAHTRPHTFGAALSRARAALVASAHHSPAGDK